MSGRTYLSRRVQSLPKGAVRTMFDRAASMKDVINMGIGEPDQDTPPAICEAAGRALAEGKTHYTANAGIRPLRAAAAGMYEKKGAVYDPDTQVIVTTGGTGALILAFLTLLDPGEEVLIPDPVWLNYSEEVRMCGGRAVRVPCCPDDGFRLRPEALESVISGDTRAILLNDPCNPTGQVCRREELEEIARIARKHDLTVISDEVYNTLWYGDLAPVSMASLPGMKERTVVINSLSKSYAMTGWRIGFACGAAEIIDRMVKTQEYFCACVNSFSQWGAVYALEHPELAEGIRREFAARREVLIRELSEVPGVVVPPAEGTFYIFLDIRAFGMPSAEFCDRLLEEAGVVCIPGSAFGDCGEGFLRMAYTTGEDSLREAMRRFRSFCCRLLKEKRPGAQG